MNAITGLIIRNGSIEWTALREDESGSAQRFSKTVPLDVDDSAAGDPRKVADAIRRQCPELSGRVTVGIGPDQALLSVVDLPTVDPDEIESMVRLQADKLSPFPEDRTASSFEVLKAGGESCRVMLVTARRAAVETAGEICRMAGLEVLRIDVEAMGWWRLLQDAGAVLESGRQVTILAAPEGCLIMASQDGAPASFKTTGPPDGLSEDEYAAEVTAETGSLLLALDLEHGEAPVARIDFLRTDATSGKIAVRLREEFGCEVPEQPLEDLPRPSEGLARRAMHPPFSIKAPRGIHSVIDLVPRSWRAAAESALFKRRAAAAAAVVLCAWLAGLALLGLGHRANLRRLRDVERRMAAIQGPADEVRALQRRVNSFEQYLDRERSALECLLEFSRALPDGVLLTSFQFRKGRNVVVRGESLSVDSIIDFKQQMDGSELFESIDMGAIQPRRRRDTTVQTFHMDARMPEQDQ